MTAVIKSFSTGYFESFVISGLVPVVRSASLQMSVIIVSVHPSRDQSCFGIQRTTTWKYSVRVSKYPSPARPAAFSDSRKALPCSVIIITYPVSIPCTYVIPSGTFPVRVTQMPCGLIARRLEEAGRQRKIRWSILSGCFNFCCPGCLAFL
jgi:hypothetical protein